MCRVWIRTSDWSDALNGSVRGRQAPAHGVEDSRSNGVREVSIHAVQQTPVTLQRSGCALDHTIGLGLRLRLVLAHQLGDQLPCLARVLDVELGVELEVLDRRAFGRIAIALEEPLKLGLGDRRLARLDRVQHGEMLQGIGTRSPRLSASVCLTERTTLAGILTADGIRERIPQRDMAVLLCRMALKAGATIPIGLGGNTVRGLRQRDDGVAVLACVENRSRDTQLTGAPALVERVLEHVAFAPGLVDPGNHIHPAAPLVRLGSERLRAIRRTLPMSRSMACAAGD